MDSRNQKQEELIKRLEEIRRQRSTIQTDQPERNDGQPMRRNQSSGRSTRSNRNRNRQNQPSTTRKSRQSAPVSKRNTQTPPVVNDDPGRHSQETYRIGHQNVNEAEERRIRQAKIQDKVRSNQITNKKIRTQKKQSNPLLDQLSDGDKLSQAIVLSEILSKPIALRPKSR